MRDEGGRRFFWGAWRAGPTRQSGGGLTARAGCGEGIRWGGWAAGGRSRPWLGNGGWAADAWPAHNEREGRGEKKAKLGRCAGELAQERGEGFFCNQYLFSITKMHDSQTLSIKQQKNARSGMMQQPNKILLGFTIIIIRLGVLEVGRVLAKRSGERDAKPEFSEQ